SVVQRLAGRRVTLRLEADPAHMIFDGVLARAMPLTPSATTTPDHLINAVFPNQSRKSAVTRPKGIIQNCPN
ncbi:MAG: hypothetical protein ABR585_14800, partial [Gemmatimonadaceae bacterium]